MKEMRQLVSDCIDHGMMCEEPILIMYEHMEKLRTNYPIVEIGVFTGGTTKALALGAKELGIDNTIIGIDPFEKFKDPAPQGIYMTGEGKKEMTLANLEGLSNVMIIEGFSYDPEIIAAVDKVSMMFLDGCHEEEVVIQDLNNWLPKVVEYFFFHDVRYPSVQSALKRAGVEFEELFPNFGMVTNLGNY